MKMDSDQLQIEVRSNCSKLYVIIIPFVALAIIILNLFAVLSSGLFMIKRQQPRSTYLFLGNVALADLMTGVAILISRFYPKDERTDVMCVVEVGVLITLISVSVLSVLLVAIDRFLFINYGLQYQRYIFPRRARILITTTWIFACLVGMLPLIAPDLRGQMSYQQCSFILLNSEYLLGLLTVGIIPIILVVIVYAAILFRALKKLKALKNTSRASITTDAVAIPDLTISTTVQATEALKDEKSKKCLICCCWKSPSDENISEANPTSDPELAKWRAIKIVVLTSGTIAITMLPYFIVSLMYIYCDHENHPNYCDVLKEAIASPLAMMVYVNAGLNPVIYAWWHSGFRTIRSMDFVRFIKSRKRHQRYTDF